MTLDNKDGRATPAAHRPSLEELTAALYYDLEKWFKDGRNDHNDSEILGNIRFRLAAAVRAPSGEGRWQDIATAPKDGTMILIAGQFDGDGRWLQGTGCWRNHGDNYQWSWSWHVKPTHWQPLPAPPGSGASQGCWFTRQQVSQVMDALESDADLDARRAAFEMIQELHEPENLAKQAAPPGFGDGPRLDGDCPLGPNHQHKWTLWNETQCQWCMQTKAEVAQQIAAGAGAVAPPEEPN